MAQAAPAADQDPHKIPTTGRSAAARAAGRAKGRQHGARPGSRGRDRTRGHPGRRRSDRAGVRDHGVPGPREQGRWRAVWYENGERQQCEAATEEKLAARLEKVTERLEADAPNMKRPGADLIAHYLDPDRLPVRGAVVPQARAHPAQAVRAVRRPGHRRGHVPGHQDRAYAADRQRRAHAGEGAGSGR